MATSAAINTDLTYLQASKGLKSWLFTLDHKRIALLYLYTVISFFLVGVLLGGLIRLELIAPGVPLETCREESPVCAIHGGKAVACLRTKLSDKPARFLVGRHGSARACRADLPDRCLV